MHPSRACSPRSSAAALIAAAAAAAVALAPAVVRADTPAPDPDAARIAAAGKTVSSNWTPPGRSDRYGHAETLVHAPLAEVRRRVVDFAHYKEYLPEKFRTSRVVGHGADGSSDVYVQAVAMNGLLTFWNVTHFEAPKTIAPDTEVIEGRMVPGKGNIDDGDLIWTLHAVGPEWTVLKLELLLKPGLPLPRSLMDTELRDDAREAVDAVHDRAQGSPGIAPYPG